MSQLQALWEFLIPLMRTALSRITVETYTDWGTCVATACVSILYNCIYGRLPVFHCWCVLMNVNLIWYWLLANYNSVSEWIDTFWSAYQDECWPVCASVGRVMTWIMWLLIGVHVYASACFVVFLPCRRAETHVSSTGSWRCWWSPLWVEREAPS